MCLDDKKNYLDKMPQLLKKWQASAEADNIYKNQDNPCANIFISDGIAHPDTWFTQKIRPLFVLKEAYDKSGEQKSWDEVKWFLTTKEENGDESGGKTGKIEGQTWKTICQWVSYIFEGNYDCDTVWGNKNLGKIALINIKKYGGYERSSSKDLQKHAEKYSKYIYEQIKLIKPTIIICGYTGWLLDIVWEKNNKQAIRKNCCGGHVYDIPEINAKLIDFWHPSARIKGLKNAFIADVDIALEKTDSNETNDVCK